MIHLHNVFTNSHLDEIIKIMSKYSTIIAKEVHMFKQTPNWRNGVVTFKMKLKALKKEIEKKVFPSPFKKLIFSQF